MSEISRRDLIKMGLMGGVAGTISNLVEATDVDYEDIRKLVNKVPTTCGVGCHPRIKL